MLLLWLGLTHRFCTATVRKLVGAPVAGAAAMARANAAAAAATPRVVVTPRTTRRNTNPHPAP